MASTPGDSRSGERSESDRVRAAANAERRRRRQRSGPVPAPPPGPPRVGRDTSADTAPILDPDLEPISGPPTAAAPAAAPGEDREAERGLRGLVGSGATQVAVGAALRARDATRPTEADLAATEEQLVIVRRGWVPRDELPRR
jgi:hypothetical protein